MIAWLEDLAAADRIELSELTTRRYLKSQVGRSKLPTTFLAGFYKCAMA
jgi:hypothetical protein